MVIAILHFCGETFLCLLVNIGVYFLKSKFLSDLPLHTQSVTCDLVCNNHLFIYWMNAQFLRQCWILCGARLKNIGRELYVFLFKHLLGSNSSAKTYYRIPSVLEFIVPNKQIWITKKKSSQSAKETHETKIKTKYILYMLDKGGRGICDRGCN